MAHSKPPPVGRQAGRLFDRVRGELRGAIGERLLWQAVAFVAAAAWVGLALDRLLEPPGGVRLAVEIALASFALGWLAFRAAPHLLRPISDAEVVTLLAPHAQRDAGLIGSALQIDQQAEPGADRLVDATRRQADEAAERLADVRLVKSPSSMPVVWFGAVLLAGTAVLATARPDLATAYASRLTLSAEPWPRRVQLVAEGMRYDEQTAQWSVVAARGEPFEAQFQAASAEGGSLPTAAWFRRLDGDRRAWRALTRLDGASDAEHRRFRWRTDRLDDDAELTVLAGDARLEARIVAKDRPRLRDVTLAVKPPDYLGRSPTQTDVATLGSLPEGASVTLRGDAGRRLASVEAWLETDAEDPPDPVEAWLVGEEGEVAVGAPLLDASRRLVIRVTDRDGLTSDPLAIVLEVTPDTPPEARLARSGSGRAVTRDARIRLGVDANDDNALAQVALVVASDETEVVQPLPTPRLLPATIDATVDLLSLRAQSTDESLSVGPGARLSITAVASDRYDLADRPPTISDPVAFEVVTPAEMLARLGEAQRELRRSIDGVREDVRRLGYEIDLRRRREAEGVATDAASPGRWTAERQLDTRKAADLVRAAGARGDAIRQQAVDNRLEQPALVERLALQVVAPLRAVERVDLTRLQSRLDRFANSGGDAALLADAESAAREAEARLDQVAEALQVEQSYNSLLTSLRALIREQRQVNQRTAREKGEQARRALFE